jgi:hypothetical protein
MTIVFFFNDFRHFFPLGIPYFVFKATFFTFASHKFGFWRGSSGG